MTAELRLTGYAYSVYTRAVRMALQVKELDYAYAEADPFDAAQRVRIPHPFGRVPVLDHGRFRVYETQAILDYLEAMWPDTALTPDAPQAQARMRQVMAITDSYVYRPLVRQVASHALFLPAEGQVADRGIIADGLRDAETALGALNEIAEEGLVLCEPNLQLSDCLLWPMLDYFNQVPQGADALARYPALKRWVSWICSHPVARATAPDMEGYGV